MLSFILSFMKECLTSTLKEMMFWKREASFIGIFSVPNKLWILCYIKTPSVECRDIYLGLRLSFFEKNKK
jgi:hypothetical protein